jgi:hypothetical protein
MAWYIWLGKLFPWAVGGAGIVFELTGVVPSWWPTILAFATGFVQLIISAAGPAKTVAAPKA